VSQKKGSVQLEKQYTLRQRAEVCAILAGHPYVVELLLEAAPVLEAHFPAAPLFLELVTDPETAGQRILVLAAIALPIEQSLAKLEEFDDAWWLANVARAQGKVCIDTESR
jgi:hypothetical protein